MDGDFAMARTSAAQRIRPQAAAAVARGALGAGDPARPARRPRGLRGGLPGARQREGHPKGERNSGGIFEFGPPPKKREEKNEASGSWWYCEAMISCGVWGCSFLQTRLERAQLLCLRWVPLFQI